MLPWLVAAASACLAVASWVGSPRAPEPGPQTDLSEPRALKTLRLAVATARLENQALRRELDRLLTAPAAKKPASAAEAAGEAAADGAESEARRRDVTERLRQALERAASGNLSGKVEAGRAVWEALNLREGAFAALRDAYLGSPDPWGRKLLVGAMYFSRSPEVRDFLAEQAAVEKDPDLRRVLVTQAAKYATPDNADRLERTFVASLGSSDDPALRRAAVRGLRYARGDGVMDALFGAASDPDEGVRLAAIEVLSSRPELRDALADVVSRDASARVREIGNCRLLVSRAAE